ncbi:MAG: aldehyde dehydrogenase family protein [Acidimicrobiia bacterium]|nr:aldehyde dehydrogenase family protein [Acidimicrobiia bacterium]
MTSVTAQLNTPRQLIDGIWHLPTHVLDHHLVDPATGAPIQSQVASSLTDIDLAVEAAWRAHRADPLGIGTPEQRIIALETAADHLDTIAPKIAEQDSLNSGIPVTITRLFAGALASTFRGAAARVIDVAPTDLSSAGRRVTLSRLPLGPAAILAPWNAPTAVAAKKTAYAWAAGCPVIVKPSPWSPNGTTLLVEILEQAAATAGLSHVAIQLVLGGIDAGQALAEAPHVRVLSFTGSRVGGRAVAAAAAANVPSIQLELGSNNPALVLSDADLELTATQLAAGMTKLNGAWCESPGTVFVPPSLREELIELLSVRLSELRVGSPLDPDAEFGPQSNPAQYATLQTRLGQFMAAGTRTVTVGAMPPQGLWIPPTLVIDPPLDLAAAETFGPVLVLRTCLDTSTALVEAASLETGLAGYVFTRSIDEGHRIGRLLPVGEVKINGTSLLDMSEHSTQEFWYGSGVGRHGDAELLRLFTGARIVGEDVDSPL